MAAGRAKLLHQETGKRIAIGKPNQIIWCDLYNNNPYLVTPSELPYRYPTRHEELEGMVWLYDYPGARPYIDYQATRLHSDNRRLKGIKNTQRWVWNIQYGPPEPAEIFLTEEEEWQASKYMRHPYVIVDPHIKAKAPPNKRWYFDYFQQVVDAIEPYVEVIQPIYARNDVLQGVSVKPTSVREMAVWMSRATCLVTNEGLLHHMAAAFTTPAVVIAGAFVPKDVSGYAYQTWFTKKDKRVIGVRVECTAGLEAMKAIKPPEVISAVKRIMKEAGI